MGNSLQIREDGVEELCGLGGWIRPGLLRRHVSLRHKNGSLANVHAQRELHQVEDYSVVVNSASRLHLKGGAVT